MNHPLRLFFAYTRFAVGGVVLVRYLVEAEFRLWETARATGHSAWHAQELRRELTARNRIWAAKHGFVHEETTGGSPALLYQEDERGRHGNFSGAAYGEILRNPLWRARLKKAHTSARRVLVSHDRGRRELDSSHSSDALLMNIFCHPETLATRGVRQLLDVAKGAVPLFGYRPRCRLLSGHVDRTEIDCKLDGLLLEAKLTEYDFQEAPMRLMERYEGLEEVIDVGLLERADGKVDSYQLVRGVMAAAGSAELRFGVICDARRPDLIARWERVLSAVKRYDVRWRLVLLTWQELSGMLPGAVQDFLEEKYGIRGSRAGDGCGFMPDGG